MKDDVISRQAAVEEMKNMYHAAEKWGEEASDDVIKARAESCMASLIEMKMRIEKLPSAQPEIVRCKDCAHNCGELDGYICCDTTEEISIWHSEDWFCADGEKEQ